MTIQSDLTALGLSHYEAKALTSLFEKEYTLKELSKTTNIPFGRIYSVIRKLKGEGLVNETNDRPKKVFVESSSDIVQKLVKQKEQETQELTLRVKQAATEFDKGKKRKTPFFQVGTTQENNRDIQLRSFQEAEHEVLQIINIHHKPHSNRRNKTLWEKSIKDAIERGVIFRAIYPTEVQIPTMLRQLSKKNIKMFQTKRYNTDFVRCDIIDGKKVLIKLVQKDPLNFGGVFFIEDTALAQNLSMIFDELWGLAE